MLTRDQFDDLKALQQCKDSFFSWLPLEMLLQIYETLPSKNSGILKALDLAADAEEEAVNELLAMLEKDPSLLLQAGNVVTRGGNTIIRVTPYEFALGEGDPELAARIAPYFDKLDGGEAERERQYMRYKPYIFAMPTQAPDDLSSLFTIIKNSSAADVTAALNKDFDHDNELNRALNAFRETHAPRIIRTPRLHYNHKTLEQAFTLLDKEWGAFSANYTNYDKCRLVYRQIIGYLQLTLPGIDRIAFARAFQDKMRTLEFIWGGGRFPDTRLGGWEAGLDFGEYIWPREFYNHRWWPMLLGGQAGTLARIKIHIEQKFQLYRTDAANAVSGDNTLCAKPITRIQNASRCFRF